MTTLFNISQALALAVSLSLLNHGVVFAADSISPSPEKATSVDVAEATEEFKADYGPQLSPADRPHEILTNKEFRPPVPVGRPRRTVGSGTR